MIYINGEKTNTEELIKLFDIPIPERNSKGKKIAVFKRFGFKKDELNQMNKTGVKSIPRNIRVIHPQEGMLDIVFTNLPYNRDLGVAQDRELEMFSTDSLTVDCERELEKYLRLYLSPNCEQSPAFTKKAIHINVAWKLDDSVALARQINEEEGVKAELLVTIKNMPENEMKNLLAVYNYTGLADKTPEEMRKELYTLAKANYKDFIQKMNSSDNKFIAIMNQAVDLGILLKKNIHGVDRWHFVDGDKTSEVGVVESGEDAVEKLRSIVLRDYTGEGSLWNKVKNLVEGKDSEVAKQLSQKEELDELKQLVDEFEAVDFIEYDKKEKSVYYKSKDGRGEELFKPSTPLWRNELAEYLLENSDVKSSFVKKKGAARARLAKLA